MKYSAACIEQHSHTQGVDTHRRVEKSIVLDLLIISYSYHTSSSSYHLSLRSSSTAFDELDPENNGFCSVEQLSTLMAKITDVQVPQGTKLEDVKRRLDPDGLGVILYERLLTVLDQWERQVAMESVQSSQPSQPFTCSACTFDNPASAKNCEICGTVRPPPPAPVKKEEIEIQNFTLFHFNGIEIPGKVRFFDPVA